MAEDDSFHKAMKGRLTDLPPEESSAVRVFFSSTFTDMTVERNLLMREAVPHLRAYCKDHGLDFQVVDMRWGVKEDAGLEHTTTDICMEEIDRCQRESAGPNFVAFLGDRYGSRLLPTTIPVTEFRYFRRLAFWMLKDEFEIVEKWYALDTNAVPAVYQIQPITVLLPHYNDTETKNRLIKLEHQQIWERDQNKMLTVFKILSDVAFSKSVISEEAYKKYYTSVTHQEVLRGLKYNPDVINKNINTALIFQRNLMDIKYQDNIAGRFIDIITEGLVDAEAMELCQELKDSVVTPYLDASCISSHVVCWAPGKGIDPDDSQHDAYLHKFSDIFTARMKLMIDKCSERKLKAPPTRRQELYREVVTHLHFCKKKCKNFCGQGELLQNLHKLLSTVHSTDHEAKELRGKAQKLAGYETSDKVTNIPQYHETGFTNLGQDENPKEAERQQQIHALMDFTAQTGATFSFGDAFDDDDGDPKCDVMEEGIAMPRIERFKRPVFVYGRGGSGKTALMARVVQLSHHWVPGSACIVRFMGSTSNSTDISDVLLSVVEQVMDLYRLHPPVGLDLRVDYFYLILYFHALLWRIDSQETPLFVILDSVDQLSRANYAHLLEWVPKMVPVNVYFIVSLATDHPIAGDCLSNAKQRVPFEEQFLELQPLDQTSADKMIRSICHGAGRTLTAAQRHLVLQTYGRSGQVLHLKLITEQALAWRSHYSFQALSLADTLSAAVEQLFDQVEKAHGHVLVSRMLGYLTVAKSGLTDGEIEDLLSLDDEVLQDTFVYHLPPDPHLIRIPSSVWVSVKSHLSSYLAKQQAGGRQVNVWYHRHFKEVAQKRYAMKDAARQMHQALADYFLGKWSHQPKPLELLKGKKGSFEDCVRGVPDQPIIFDGFNKLLYNQRKLIELPHHLTLSGRFRDFHTHIACSVAFLTAVCHCLGVGTLLTQLGDMISQHGAHCQTQNKEEEDLHFIQDIKFVRDVVRLGADDIRRDPNNLPLQILGQLGPSYGGSLGITELVRQCRDFLAASRKAMMEPYNAFMPAPGGLLLSSVNIRLFVMGADRESAHCLHVDETKQCMYVIEWDARDKPDSVVVIDYENGGACISRERLPFHIHSMHFVAKNRFIVVKAYQKLSKYEAKFRYVLYEGSLGTLPYRFDNTVQTIGVASHGQLVAFAYEGDKRVHLGNPVSKSRHIDVKMTVVMKQAIHVVLFSPSAQHLVAIDRIQNITVYSIQQKQSVSLHTSTERDPTWASWIKPPGLKLYHITHTNLLLRSLKGEKMDGPWSLTVVDLVTRQERHRLTQNKLLYDFSFLVLDKQEEFVLAAHRGDVIINGNTFFPGLIWHLSDGLQTTTISARHSWQTARLTGEDTLYCIASWGQEGVINVLSCGPRQSPFPNGQLLMELRDHTKTIVFLEVIESTKCLVSGSMDNTIKFWDLDRILTERCIDKETGQSDKKENGSRDGTVNDVECLGKTTALVTTGLDDPKAYFGTENGVVAFTRLPKDDACPVTLETLADGLPPVHLMVLSKKGDYLMAAATDVVAVFDARRGELLYKIPGVKNRGKISFIADGGNTAALSYGGMDGKVKLWYLATGEIIKEMEALYAFNVTAISNKGTQVVASMFEYPLVLNIFAKTEEEKIAGNSLRMDKLDVMMSGLTCVCVSPDDRLVAACSSDGSTRVVSTSNVYLHRLQQRSSPTCAVFTENSQQLLTGGFRTVYIWQMGSGQLAFKLSRHQDFITSLCLARQDRFLLSSSLDRTVAVWDMKSRATVCMVRAQCQLHNIQTLPDLSRLVYIPDRVASIAVLRPNPILQDILDNGRSLGNMVDDPETLEQASSFATAFNTQKAYGGHNTQKAYGGHNTSQACRIL